MPSEADGEYQEPEMRNGSGVDHRHLSPEEADDAVAEEGLAEELPEEDPEFDDEAAAQGADVEEVAGGR